MNKFYSSLIGCMSLILLISCSAPGHDDYLNFENSMVGKKIPYTEPFKFKSAGKLIRADFLMGGPGLTHITKDKHGNLLYHFSSSEVLPNYHKKEWVGKCMTYYVVDPETYIIKSWGFDEGGNPLSCRTWP